MLELKELLSLENLIIMVSHEYPVEPSEIHYWGGMGTVCKSVSERLVHRGYEVLVLPRRVREYAAEGTMYFEKNGVHILSLPIKPYQGGDWNKDLYNIYPIKEGVTTLDHCYTSWRFLESLGMKNPIIHNHDWLSAGIAREAKRAGYRNIFSVHMSSERDEERLSVDKRLELERLTGNYSDKIHYVSLSQRSSCKVYGWNSNKEHVVIPNGVDIHKYTPPEQKPIEDYVLFVGRLSPVKNVPALIRGWSIVNKEYPDLKLKILGASGISNIDVTEIIASLDPDQKSKVELKMEMVSEQERIEYYQKCSLGCFPSSKEAFGVVAVECQACGKPVVVGDVGGFKENVLEGVTGIHVKGIDPKCISEGIRLAYENKDSWGKNARKLTKEFFDWDKLVDDYVEDLYKE